LGIFIRSDVSGAGLGATFADLGEDNDGGGEEKD